jgi:hypothetical protein
MSQLTKMKLVKPLTFLVNVAFYKEFQMKLQFQKKLEAFQSILQTIHLISNVLCHYKEVFKLYKCKIQFGRHHILYLKLPTSKWQNTYFNLVKYEIHILEINSNFDLQARNVYKVWKLL